MPFTLGIAQTKTLAKFANHPTKLSAKTAGVLELTDSPPLDLALGRTPVGGVWLTCGPRVSSR